MELLDLLKQIVNGALPRGHQFVLAILFAGLLLVLAIVNNTGFPDSNDNLIANQAFQDKASNDSLDLNSEDTNQPALSTPPRLFLEVGSGDNLSLLFNKAGLDSQEVYTIANSGPEAGRLADLYPGYQLAFEIDPDNKLSSLEVIKSPLESYLFTRAEQNQYDFSLIEREPKVEQVYKEAVITDSLFQAAQRGGIPAAMTLDLAGIFGGVIDFILDTRDGDTFNLIYEEKYLDGKFIGFGKILAAQFTNQGQTYTAVRYENANGEANFFNLEGESMRKAFLLNPVDFTRISSGFNLSRRHPILNTIRAHKGTDYAAPKGTPVVATADGRVTFASRKGTFGKLIVIQHGDRFETKYAHLNEYAKGISSGVRVKQGQVIGYVGSTGGATGPHLHYEFLMDGVHRNSRTIYDQLPRAESIAADEMPQFQQQAQGLIALMASKGHSTNALAQNTPTSSEE